HGRRLAAGRARDLALARGGRQGRGCPQGRTRPEGGGPGERRDHRARWSEDTLPQGLTDHPLRSRRRRHRDDRRAPRGQGAELFFHSRRALTPHVDGPYISPCRPSRAGPRPSPVLREYDRGERMRPRRFGRKFFGFGTIGVGALMALLSAGRPALAQSHDDHSAPVDNNDDDDAKFKEKVSELEKNLNELLTIDEDKKVHVRKEFQEGLPMPAAQMERMLQLMVRVGDDGKLHIRNPEQIKPFMP